MDLEISDATAGELLWRPPNAEDAPPELVAIISCTLVPAGGAYANPNPINAA